MARGPKRTERRQANLTAAQMHAAIPMIDRRLADLEAFDPASVNESKRPKNQGIIKQA
jgi:hypothetical protein